jgi:hypothetical protein
MGSISLILKLKQIPAASLENSFWVVNIFEPRGGAALGIVEHILVTVNLFTDYK